jgi:hypothetical protein
MIKLIYKFSQLLKNKKLINVIFKKLKVNNRIYNRQIYLSQKLIEDFNGIVRYGLFKGSKFCRESLSLTPYSGSILLGIYEQEILTSLKRLPKKFRYFVNVGSDIGYYSIGSVVSKLFKKSWCYEISEYRQRMIKINAQLNNISNKIVVYGKADANFYKNFSEEEANRAVLLVDIEGGEFKFFNQKVFKKFRNSIIFIELHDFLISNGKKQVAQLKKKAKQFHNITVLTTTQRDLSIFKELKEMSDTDRWLICSEGRERLMTWWRLDPIFKKTYNH